MRIVKSALFEQVVQGYGIAYVDAGARGSLEGAWRHLPTTSLRVLAFEPDQNAAVDLEGQENGIVERTALWSDERNLTVSIGRIPATSSVWPPNMPLLQRFSSQHVAPRETVRSVLVPAKPLDTIVSARGFAPDFLKIDTQGSEMEILLGSRNALADSLFGVVVETWTTEIHAGQGITAQVMALMHEHGFELFDIEVAAAWHRRVCDEVQLSTRRQVVGLDLLYFREPQLILQRFKSPRNTLVYAAIAELYGHYDLAVEMIEIHLSAESKYRAEMQELRSMLIEAYAPPSSAPVRPNFLSRLGALLKGLRKRKDAEVTRLHY